MTVFLLILRWLGWTVLVLLGLVLVLALTALFVPVHLLVRYDSAGFRAAVRVLWIRKRIYPTPKNAPVKPVAAVPKHSAKEAAVGPVAEAPSPITAEPVKKSDTTGPAVKPPTDSAPARFAEQQETRAIPAPAAANVPHEETVEKQKAPAGNDRKTGRANEKKVSSPAPPKKRRAPKPPKAKHEKDGDSQAKEILQKLPVLLGAGKRFLRAFLRALRVRHVRVVVPIAASRPDETARDVGRAYAWFYAMTGLLGRSLKLSLQEVRFPPDYYGTGTEKMLLSARIDSRLFPLAVAGLHLYNALKKEGIL